MVVTRRAFDLNSLLSSDKVSLLSREQNSGDPATGVNKWKQNGSKMNKTE